MDPYMNPESESAIREMLQELEEAAYSDAILYTKESRDKLHNIEDDIIEFLSGLITED